MKKDRIFSFKANSELAARLDQLPNRSAFVRQAVEAALETHCPLCQGTGVLSDEQRHHWDHFLHHHSLEKCDECNAVHFVCQDSKLRNLH